MDVDATIALQLSRIYSDDFINDDEALLKVDLQEIFDLSFDEMNEYAQREVTVSLAKVLMQKTWIFFSLRKNFSN